MHDILVLIDPRAPREPVADFALGLASRFSANATVTAVTASELPVGYMLEGGRALIDELQMRARTAMNEALEGFVATARSCGVIAETVPLEGAAPDLHRSVAELARHFDLSVPEATTDDQAAAILFFASDDSKAVTGQCLTVDNGATL